MRVVLRSRVALVALMVPLVACDGDATSDASYPVLEHPEPRPEDILTAREVLRLGSVGGDGPDVFGRVDYVGLDAGGLLYVLDGIAQEMRVFDLEGRHVRSLGGEGEGPGEFVAASGAAFHPDGSLWVWDPRQQRLSVFDSLGELRETIAREWRTYGVPWVGRFDEAGRLLDVAVAYPGLDPRRAATRSFEALTRAVRHDALARPVDSLPPLMVERTAFAGNYRVPFEGGLVSAFEADGTSWSSHGPSYRLLRVSATGDTLLGVVLDAPPVPVSSAERDSAIASYRLPAEAPALDPDLVPEHKPAVVRLVDLGDGWVAAFPEMGGDTGRYVDVFSPDGSHRGRVDLGVTLLVPRSGLDARGSLLCGVATDAFNVPYVVVLDLGLPELDRVGAAVSPQ